MSDGWVKGGVERRAVYVQEALALQAGKDGAF
jgi:hypothetical protein